MRPAVSVVVPVFNPGPDVDRCLESLLGQTLPPGKLELIFVDDGSTDATPARLEALAAEHDHVRLERIPNSGWPGRPRNIGMDLARGDYVYFVDDDDYLEPDALERMHAAALEDGADIVIGKVVGHGKTVPRGIFRETLRAVPFDSGKSPGGRFPSGYVPGGHTPMRLLGLLTPHKLFRRGLLVEHEIRFPEGRRRLEDHLFVVHAYFHAAGISVLADRPYYHWTTRERTPNASHGTLDPQGYYGNVREVLDLVLEHTDPGPFRDRLLTHWYRGKMLQRVGGRKFARRDDAHNRELVDTIRALALERYDERVHERLAFNLQVRSALLRAGRFEDLQRLAQFEAGLRAGIKARVRGGGRRLTLELTATLRGLELESAGEALRWRPPEALPGLDLDMTSSLGGSYVQVYVHSLRDGGEYVLPAETEVELDRAGHVVLTTRVEVDPRVAAGGSALPAGDFEVRANVNVAGFSHARSVRRNGAPLVLTSSPPRLVARRDVLLRQPMARRLAGRFVPRAA
jgi:poly(ribitol-phosphate) beta-N-acetylglucosaminyltransferase